MSNSTGSYATTPQHTMAAYDKLPPTARKALQNSVFCWAVQPILTRWRNGRRGYKTGADIAETIRQWDIKHVAKDRKRVWGINDAPAPRQTKRRRRS